MQVFNKAVNKYKSLSKPAKASVWFIACYVIQRGLQFLGMPIYTRIMSTDEYGEYSVFLSWFNILCVFSSLSIYNGTFNKAMVKYENERDKYISSVQWLTLLFGLIFSIAILSYNSIITTKTGYSLKFQLLLAIHLLFFPSLQYWSQKQRFLFEYKKLVLITLINSALSLGMGIVFVLVSEEKSFALVATTVMAQAAINVILFISLSIKGKKFYQREYWGWSLKTSIPLIPHYLSEILLGHADRLMINQMCGSSEAGIYNIVYQISMIMTIIRTGINGSFTPWFFLSLKEEKYDDVKKTSRLIAILMAGLTLAFMLVSPELLRIVAPPTYYEAVTGIPAIMIGCYFIFIYVLFLNVEIFYEQNQFVAVASIIAAVVNVLLNYICINRFGYIAAAYTTMASYMLMAFLHYLFFLRIAKNHRELRGIYDVRSLFVCSFVLIAIGIWILFLYDYVLIRYIITLVVSVITYKFRKNNVRTFNT